MHEKGAGCWSITRDELLAAMRSGAVLRWTKFGPCLFYRGRELHPRRDTVCQLIADGTLLLSDDATKAQRECGTETYRIAAEALPPAGE